MPLCFGAIAEFALCGYLTGDVPPPIPPDVATACVAITMGAATTSALGYDGRMTTESMTAKMTLKSKPRVC